MRLEELWPPFHMWSLGCRYKRDPMVSIRLQEKSEGQQRQSREVCADQSHPLCTLSYVCWLVFNFNYLLQCLNWALLYIKKFTSPSSPTWIQKSWWLWAGISAQRLWRNPTPKQACRALGRVPSIPVSALCSLTFPVWALGALDFVTPILQIEKHC